MKEAVILILSILVCYLLCHKIHIKKSGEGAS